LKKNIKFSRNQFNVDKLKKWAKSVKKRDGYRCRACGYRKVLHSHHILPKGKNKEYAYYLWNGITLCKICHLSTSGVHGSGEARNKMVEDLRKLSSSEKTDVKSFDSTNSEYQKKKPTKYKRYTRRFYK
tara:strand:- start:276 stop:662 length:387 start_codon:yes stop_codon:yes gene_type:complete